MTTEERERELRLTVREVVNKLPIHLDTSADLEEAIELISACVRAAQAETWRKAADKAAEKADQSEYVNQGIEFDDLAAYCEQQARQAETGKEGG